MREFLIKELGSVNSFNKLTNVKELKEDFELLTQEINASNSKISDQKLNFIGNQYFENIDDFEKFMKISGNGEFHLIDASKFPKNIK